MNLTLLDVLLLGSWIGIVAGFTMCCWFSVIEWWQDVKARRQQFEVRAAVRAYDDEKSKRP